MTSYESVHSALADDNRANVASRERVGWFCQPRLSQGCLHSGPFARALACAPGL